MFRESKFSGRIGSHTQSNLSLSAVLFLSNTMVSLFVAIMVITFFGWEDYGSLITILTFSFLLNQIATGGSQNEIFKVNANAPGTNLKSLYREGVKNKRISNLLVTLLILTIVTIDLLNVAEMSNIDTTMLVIMFLSSVVSPNLRIRLSLFVSNERFKLYFLLTLVRNLIFLVLVLISTLIESTILAYASFVVADAVLAFTLFLIFRKITVDNEPNLVAFEARSSFQFTCLNLYHELIPKIDLLCLFFLADSSFIGKYSILALLSDGMHALYGVIRTQNTPKFTASGVTETKLLFVDLRRYLYTSATILSMGFIVIMMIQFMKLVSINNGPGLLTLLSLNSILLFFPIIYASVLTQWNMHTLQLKLSMMHLIFSLSIFVLGYHASGLTFALGLLSIVNTVYTVMLYHLLKNANPFRAQL
jgi:O-antigen/teichoic acid export membrane protein